MAAIGIVFLGYYFAVSTQVVETAKELANAGFEVDIFLDSDNANAGPPVRFDSQRIRVVVGEARDNLSSGKETGPSGREIVARPSCLGRLARRLLRPPYYVLHRLRRPRYGLTDFLRERAAKWGGYLELLSCEVARREYVALIGVEAGGLAAAAFARDRAQRADTALVYYNLELMQDSWWHSCDTRLLKRVEVAQAARCAFTVIGDEERGAVFSRSTGVPQPKLRYLTVSTGGPAVYRKGAYFRSLFSIPADRMIVLYAGNIRPWAMCREVVRTVPQWPANCILVLHTWRKDFEGDAYCQSLRRIADPRRVFFSTTPLAAPEFLEALSSADVGLALYRPLDDNFKLIGSSSNKFALYAKVGLPVITNSNSSTRRLIEKFHSGFCITSVSEVGKALSSIASGYSGFRSGAFESYTKHYEFGRAFAPLLDEFEEMARQRCGGGSTGAVGATGRSR